MGARFSSKSLSMVWEGGGGSVYMTLRWSFNSYIKKLQRYCNCPGMWGALTHKAVGGAGACPPPPPPPKFFGEILGAQQCIQEPSETV